MIKTEVQNKSQILKRIQELEERLANPPIFPTEVYTRIVGYYRSVAAWNKGKREEYNFRKVFEVGEPQQIDLSSRPKNYAQSYLFFFRQTCPACPAMKQKVDTLEMQGLKWDVDTAEGLEAAVKYQVMATPTVIFLDQNKSELLRLSDPRDWDQVQKVVSPV